MITALQISAVDDPATDATVLEKFIGLSIIEPSIIHDITKV